MIDAPAEPPGLVRRLGLWGVLSLTLSVATPASSVFVILPEMLQVAGTGALWAMALATLVCVCTAFIYAELSSVWPVAGAEYVAVAHTLGPRAGFAMLGISVFNNIFFPPLAGLGIAAVLGVVVPGLPAVPIALLVVGGAMLVALLDIRVNALVTGVFLAVEVLALGIVAWLGFAQVEQPLLAMLTAPASAQGAVLAPVGAAAIGSATVIAIFALNGYGVAVYFGEEMVDASQRIARAILLALLLTVVLEGLPLVAGLIGAPNLHAFLTADDPFGLLVALRGGGVVAGLVATAVVVAIANAIIASILACARFFYCTGRDGSWGRPVDRWLHAVHPRFGSPHVGTLLVGGIGLACCFLSVKTLALLSGAGLVAIYVGIALATLAGRWSGRTANAAYRMPLFPLAPAVTLLTLAYVVRTSWQGGWEEQVGLLVTAAQIGLSLLYYELVLRRRGPWSPRAV